MAEEREENTVGVGVGVGDQFPLQKETENVGVPSSSLAGKQ